MALAVDMVGMGANDGQGVHPFFSTARSKAKLCYIALIAYLLNRCDDTPSTRPDFPASERPSQGQ